MKKSVQAQRPATDLYAEVTDRTIAELEAGLREDSRAIFRAASAASKAADWLLERHTNACRDYAQEEAA